MSIEPVVSVPRPPQVIRHEDGALPKKKKDRDKDQQEQGKKEKGKIDIKV